MGVEGEFQIPSSKLQIPTWMSLRKKWTGIFWSLGRKGASKSSEVKVGAGVREAAGDVAVFEGELVGDEEVGDEGEGMGGGSGFYDGEDAGEEFGAVAGDDCPVSVGADGDFEGVAGDGFEAEGELRVFGAEEVDDFVEVDEAVAEGDVGEEPALVIVLRDQVFDVDVEGERGEGAGGFEGIFHEGDVVAEIDAHADPFTADPFEGVEFLGDDLVFVVFHGEAEAMAREDGFSEL